MSIESKINDLIRAGWSVVDSDFDPSAFHQWRNAALDCFIEMLGPDHVYTRHFGKFVEQGSQTVPLAATVKLSPAQEGITGYGREMVRENGCPIAFRDIAVNPGGKQ